MSWTHGDRCVDWKGAAVSAVPCALTRMGAWLPCVGVAFTGHPRPLPKTKHLPRYRSVRCNPSGNRIRGDYQLDSDVQLVVSLASENEQNGMLIFKISKNQSQSRMLHYPRFVSV